MSYYDILGKEFALAEQVNDMLLEGDHLRVSVSPELLFRESFRDQSPL